MLLYSSEFLKTELEKFYATQFSDNILLLPQSIFKFNPYIFQNSQGNIFDLNEFIKNQLGSFWKHFEFIETEFLRFLKLDKIVEVYRKPDKLTAEQNERIDLQCYCNVLEAAAKQGVLKILYETNLPPLPNTLQGEKFSLVIHILENQKTGWAFLAAAFLLANIIETHVDVTGKTKEDVKEYWSKRFHDAISFAKQAAEFDPDIKPSVDMFLLHLKAAAEDFYPDISERISTLFLKPNIETLERFKRDPIKALLQYKRNLFIIKPEELEQLSSQEDNQNIKQSSLAS